MGAVYRATDTKLNREVAIKVLTEAFAADSARMARFQREAQTLASLNHPNIAAIYGIEQGAIVMELVEGEDLKGPVPVATAIAYGRQIAIALEASHEKGIIHRDLKPANIKVTPDGVVKLRDFGLAKAAEPHSAAASAAGVTVSPTFSMSMTQAGMILGTPLYMSPEQARGSAVDRRADIWAFGVVLFELLAGKTAFGCGETAADTIASVITREPDWSALPADTPAHLRRLLARCLRKDPKLRLRDIGEARILLDEPGEAIAAQPLEAPRYAPLPWVLAAALALTTLAAGWAAWREARPLTAPLSRFAVDLGPDSVAGAHLTAILSPDGRRLVSLVHGREAQPQLAIRLLSEANAHILAGTENAEQPFFSPDGQWIGFFAGGKLKKISAQGGAALDLCPATAAPRGASWGPGFIVANLDSRTLSRVPENGGEPLPLGRTQDRGENSWRWPQVIGNGEYVLFTAGARELGTGYENASIDVLSLRTGNVKTVARGGHYPRYLPSGHLVYVHNGTLFALPFDLNRLEARASPVPILDDVAGEPVSGAGQFSFSDTGAFVYLSGKQANSIWNLSWMDASGKAETAWTTPDAVLSPGVSPDGKRLAGSLSGEIVVYDAQSAATTKVSFPPLGAGSTVWAPDGKHLVFAGFDGVDPATLSIWWVRADGSSQPQKLLTRKTTNLRVSSFSPDGHRLSFWQMNGAGTGEAWILPLELRDPEHPRAGTPEPLPSETGGVFDGVFFSPDGHWLAYASFVQPYMPEVFVRPYPAGPDAGKYQISNTNGAFPVWSRQKPELFYNTSEGQIMVVAYQAKGASFQQEKPRQWTPALMAVLGVDKTYDLAPDGKRFAMYPQNSAQVGGGSVHVTALLNFFDELKRRLP